jgi:ATP-dependent Clp protease ATP-binding subunit ClpA
MSTLSNLFSGKRCVVVLEEIEKTEDEKSLWSLLMPWESGQCLLEPGGRPIDVRNVIWICTSNLGAQMIFELDQARSNPSKDLTREEYLGYTTQLRTLVSDKLGVSVFEKVP